MLPTQNLKKYITLSCIGFFCINLVGCSFNQYGPELAGYHAKYNDKSKRELIKTQQDNQFKEKGKDESAVLISYSDGNKQYRIEKQSIRFDSYEACQQAFNKDVDVIKSNEYLKKSKVIHNTGIEGLQVFVDDSYVFTKQECRNNDFSYNLTLEGKSDNSKFIVQSVATSIVKGVGTVMVYGLGIVLLAPFLAIWIISLPFNH